MIPSLLVLAAAAILPISNVAKSDDTQATKVVQGKAVSQWVMVGSYTDGPGDGIHVYELNPENGNLRLASVGPKTISPSFLVASADSQFVYAVNETANFDGNGAGAVSAFQFNKRTGKLTYLNSQTSGGNGPCHICLDKSGKFVMVANYGGGSIESIGVKADGSLGRVITFIQHKGTSADPKRQEGPHAHSVYFDPSGKYLVVNDLGLDRVFTYKFDAVSGELTAVKGGGMTTAPGAGPRHLAFHPNGKFAYVINELDSTINACNWMAA
ncbi:MAG: lactonase family protein, partial [Chthonomonadales bacterium]